MGFKQFILRTNFYLLSVIPLLLLISACGGGQGSSSNTTSGTGSLSFQLVWEKKADLNGVQASPSGDVCVDYAIDTIEIIVRDSSNAEVASKSPSCDAHQSIIEGVSSGSGFTVTVTGMVAGNPDWIGEADTITVNPGQNTNLDKIVMRYDGDDETPPTVSNHSPSSDATGVALDSNITATFSEAVVPASLNTSSCTLFKAGTSDQITCAVSYDEPTKTVTINPDSLLAANLEYTATITKAVQDKAGIQMSSDLNWSFTTTDVTGPVAGIVSPMDGAEDVPLGEVVVVEFNTAINPATLTSSTFMVQSGNLAVEGLITYDAITHQATFEPVGGLKHSSTYTITLTTGIQDTNGNPLHAAVTADFTTANIAWIRADGTIVKLSSSEEVILQLDEVNCTPVGGNSSFNIDQNDGGLWIADGNNDRVMKFEEDGKLTILINMRAPNGIAVDPRDGSIWVQELIEIGQWPDTTYEYRLVKFSRLGHRILNTATWSGGQGVSPVDNAMTWYPGDNSLWFADHSEPPDTRVIKLFGTDAELAGYDLSSPSGGAHHLYIDGPGEFFSVSAYPGDDPGTEGHIWVGDRGGPTIDGRAVKLGPDGSELISAIEPSGFYEVRHVSTDITDGSVWLGSGNPDRVAKYAADGSSLVNIGGFSSFGTIEADPFDGGAWIGYGEWLVKLSASGAEEWRHNYNSVDAIALVTHNPQPNTIHVSESGDDINGNGSSNSPYGTIQKGVAEASSGDIVRVSAGTYNENIALKSNIKIIGAGADVTTIQGLGTTNVVDGASVSNTVLEGFTITGSSASSNGIYCADCTALMIRQNRIQDNGDSTTSTGISLIGESTALVEHNVISGNSSGGLFIAGDSQATIRNNIIVRNGDSGIYRSGRLTDRLTTYIINNVIDSNGTEPGGRSGIMTFSDDVISNNIISNNGADNANAGLSVGIYVGGHGWTPTVSLLYNNVSFNYQGPYTGVSTGIGNIVDVDPQFEAPTDNYNLQAGSPSINAGDPDLYDSDCSRSDQGAYGGPFGGW